MSCAAPLQLLALLSSQPDTHTDARAARKQLRQMVSACNRVCLYVCACICACVRVCVRACVRACTNMWAHVLGVWGGVWLWVQVGLGGCRLYNGRVQPMVEAMHAFSGVGSHKECTFGNVPATSHTRTCMWPSIQKRTQDELSHTRSVPHGACWCRSSKETHRGSKLHLCRNHSIKHEEQGRLTLWRASLCWGPSRTCRACAAPAAIRQKKTLGSGTKKQQPALLFG